MDQQQEAPIFCNWRVEGTWRTHNHPTRFWEAYIVAPDVEGGINVARAQGASKEEATSIADHVVHAVRCHDSLVAALEALIPDAETISYGVGREERRDRIKAARAAIALAKGENK